MIEIINPGWLSLIVDEGRYGYGDIGVPPSSPLDLTAYRAVNYLCGSSNRGTPVIEVMGNDFTMKIHTHMVCAVTGALAKIFCDEKLVEPWTSFHVEEGSIVRIREVIEGLRYYVGFSGIMDIERVMNSFSTNMECRFGGYKGRPLMRGDKIGIKNTEEKVPLSFPPSQIPRITPPHRLRIIPGFEINRFLTDSIKSFVEKREALWYTVSSKSNRTGIRLEGNPLIFRDNVEKSIVSEGILSGTVQVAGDGMPIIMLSERTIGGYARLGTVAKVDHDLLAHLKPDERIYFTSIDIDDAERLWLNKVQGLSFLYKD